MPKSEILPLFIQYIKESLNKQKKLQNLQLQTIAIMASRRIRPNKSGFQVVLVEH